MNKIFLFLLVISFVGHAETYNCRAKSKVVSSQSPAIWKEIYEGYMNKNRVNFKIDDSSDDVHIYKGTIQMDVSVYVPSLNAVMETDLDLFLTGFQPVDSQDKFSLVGVDTRGTTTFQLELSDCNELD